MSAAVSSTFADHEEFSPQMEASRPVIKHYPADGSVCFQPAGKGTSG